jgi:hypothetical protein
MAFAPPNVTAPGNRAQNGYLPLARDANTMDPPNESVRDRRAGSADLAEIASPVHPPNHRFAVGMSKMPQPPSAVEPGKGSVPVNPWDVRGNPARATPERDMPRRGR